MEDFDDFEDDEFSDEYEEDFYYEGVVMCVMLWFKIGVVVVIGLNVNKVVKFSFIGFGKFCIVIDVFNWFWWDFVMDLSDFIVGYEDWFVGV